MINQYIRVGDTVEPIRGCINHGYLAEVVEVLDNRLCRVRFSDKVKPREQIRTIVNLIKLENI